MPWEERKEHTLRSLENAPLNVRLVSCADKLHNIRTIARDWNTVGDEVWARFNKGKDEQRRYYQRLVEVLCDRQDTGEYQPLFEELRREVKRVFGKEEEE
jgi:(p)ppGpp synthase/HD superfamily hydrolase